MFTTEDTTYPETKTKPGIPANSITAAGRLLNVSKSPDGSCVITLFVKENRSVYPKFMCNLPGVEDIPEHKSITVKGHVEGDLSDSAVEGVKQRFVADSVEFTPTMLEEHFGIKGKFCGPHFCKIFLTGSICKIIDDGKWMRYVVMVVIHPATVNSRGVLATVL